MKNVLRVKFERVINSFIKPKEKTMKECTKCKISQELNNFYKRKASEDGLSYHCKKCCNVEKKKWSENNREKETTYVRKWQKKNPKKVVAYTKKWRKNNPEKAKLIDKACNAKWQRDNKEKVAKNHKRYYDNNKEKFAERARNRRKANSEKK